MSICRKLFQPRTITSNYSIFTDSKRVWLTRSMSSVANVKSVAPIGFEGSIIEVESDMKNGLPSLQIVGLGNKAIEEAKERVRSAVTNSLLDFPAKKIIINLAPAELPKDGTHYDLPIALAILVSSGQLRPQEVTDAVFAGELALDGKLRPVRGAISIAETAKRSGISQVYLPLDNVAQASLIEGITIVGVSDLKELYLHLKQEVAIDRRAAGNHAAVAADASGSKLDDIHGQEQAKRALTIAAAGRHNILFSGSPGAGKTMLAQTLVNLLPPLSKAEQVAVTKLHSLAGESTEAVIATRPFRSPHHTASRVALIGGGNRPKPGEISLAHLGVLFLDEIPEYARSTLESLRQPMEDKKVAISRANGHIDYPADFMLVATMNPCPCGYYGDTTRECTCSSTQILAYQKRLSGPLLDRIDLTIPVARVPTRTLLDNRSSSSSQHKSAKKLIQQAQLIQHDRYKSSTKYNANLSSREIKHRLMLSDEVRQLLETAADKLHLSARSYFKIIKVAQTIADMEASATILPAHVAEALQYRLSTP